MIHPWILLLKSPCCSGPPFHIGLPEGITIDFCQSVRWLVSPLSDTSMKKPLVPHVLARYLLYLFDLVLKKSGHPKNLEKKSKSTILLE